MITFIIDTLYAHTFGMSPISWTLFTQWEFLDDAALMRTQPQNGCILHLVLRLWYIATLKFLKVAISSFGC